MSWRTITQKVLQKLKLRRPFAQGIHVIHAVSHKRTSLTSSVKMISTIGTLATAIVADETNLDDDLKFALEKGSTSIIDMMDQLTELVVKVSNEYRACLIKQIEITKRASNVGPLSEIWDELPEYRTLADKLNYQLNEYISIFRVIGELTYDTTLIAAMVGKEENKKEMEIVGNRFKQLEVLLLTEFEENKKKEIELLKVTRDSILAG